MKHRAVIRGIGVGVGEDGSNIPAVILKARDGFLPIVITSDRAQATQLSLSGKQSERPLTHDLLIEMVTEFGRVIDSIHIDDLSDDTFLVKVDVERYHDGEAWSIVFGARPSDAIALAIRIDYPILVSDGMLDAAGQSPETSDADFDE